MPLQWSISSQVRKFATQRYARESRYVHSASTRGAQGFAAVKSQKASRSVRSGGGGHLHRWAVSVPHRAQTAMTQSFGQRGTPCPSPSPCQGQLPHRSWSYPFNQDARAFKHPIFTRMSSLCESRKPSTRTATLPSEACGGSSTVTGKPFISGRR